MASLDIALTFERREFRLASEMRIGSMALSFAASLNLLSTERPLTQLDHAHVQILGNVRHLPYKLTCDGRMRVGLDLKII